jgi:hypothetical protein
VFVLGLYLQDCLLFVCFDEAYPREALFEWPFSVVFKH